MSFITPPHGIQRTLCLSLLVWTNFLQRRPLSSLVSKTAYCRACIESRLSRIRSSGLAVGLRFLAVKENSWQVAGDFKRLLDHSGDELPYSQLKGLRMTEQRIVVGSLTANDQQVLDTASTTAINKKNVYTVKVMLTHRLLVDK